ncbi:MAG: phospholipase [Verrucomicrobiales bacterium]|nr:phospholipase [Verrucomicrobiales bacterium]
MKLYRFPAFIVFLLLTALPAKPQNSSVGQGSQKLQTFEKEIKHKAKLDYLLFLPEGFKQESTAKYPLILFLHGMGERGADAWLVAKHGPPKVAGHMTNFPFIVVSPQCPTSDWWINEDVEALLDNVIEKYPVDKKRVYLTGLSMGGFATWSLGLSHPERYAAIAPICGGSVPQRPMFLDGERQKALKSLPVWAFHGGKDNVVKLDESQRMVDYLKSMGCKEVKFTIYPEAGHDSWVQAYNDPKLYEWFLSHSRP